MANTVSILNYTNTFGDWVATTNALVGQNNDLAANNYFKSTGTLYLNDPTLGLQVGTNALVAGQLGVRGPGSSVLIDNTLQVGGNTALANTTVYSANVTSGTLVAAGPATSFRCINDATIQGTLTIGRAIVLNDWQVQGNLTVGGATIYSTSNGLWNISITGNANTVTNGLYSTGTYANPTWLTALAASKLTGLISPSQIDISSFVTSVSGTPNQISANNSVGNVTLSLPQSIATTSNVQFRTIGVGTAADTVNNGSIRAVGTVTTSYSDDRLKTKLGTIDNALEKLMSLSGFYYEANDVAKSLGYTSKREVGLSAQATQAVLPEVVVPAPIDGNYLTIQYERVIPLLVEAIKELKAEVDALKGN